MSEPISATAATAVVGGVATAGWYAGLDAGVVVCAFAGAVFYVTQAKDVPKWTRFGFFVVSFVAGIAASRPAAELMSTVVPTKSQIPEAVGALVAAATAVNILLSLNVKAVTGKVLGFVGSAIASGMNRGGGSDGK
ncbi:antiholin/holin protein [Pectobacterium phage MA12]|uniref:Antiholin/holin protein n=1 Tax=Pectobacterium phage MA12 TaxID=2686474 RepID=A0A6B9RGZ7_9CAUD|nr:holin [Pectobacterium phage MA12]QHI00833.1 antiholin/holin protein [Pectobacterium phage MA12]